MFLSFENGSEKLEKKLIEIENEKNYEQTKPGHTKGHVKRARSCDKLVIVTFWKLLDEIFA